MKINQVLVKVSKMAIKTIITSAAAILAAAAVYPVANMLAENSIREPVGESEED